MSKNELYNSLRPKAPLSKKGISDHLSGRQRIEESTFDDFDKDAVDGWASTGTYVNTENLDKKFISKSSAQYLWIATLSIVLLGILFFTIWKTKQPTSQATIANTTTKQMVEETDLFIAEKFDTLIEKKSSNQIEISSLQEKQVDPVVHTRPEVIVEPIEIEKMPFLDVKPKYNKEEINLEKKTKIKEVYFSNFKLVDYRAIRSKPEIITRQLDLTGTAANQEDKHSKEEEPVWRSVDIPYIDFIEKSMYAMDKLQLKKALARFEVILKTYPDDINALFYSGFALYSLGEYESALGYFSQTLQSQISNFDEEALWYLGLSYEKNGESQKAKEIFSSIAKSKSYYAAEAVKKLGKH